MGSPRRSLPPDTPDSRRRRDPTNRPAPEIDPAVGDPTNRPNPRAGPGGRTQQIARLRGGAGGRIVRLGRAPRGGGGPALAIPRRAPPWWRLPDTKEDGSDGDLRTAAHGRHREAGAAVCRHRSAP